MSLTLQDPQSTLPEIIRTSKRFSAAERLLLAKALLDSLVSGEEEFANEQAVNEQDSTEDKLVLREREAYLSLHPTLLKQYPNEHVAIYQGQLVDHDHDGLALSLRIHRRFPNEFVWIAPVKAQPLEEWVVRSPRFKPIT